MLDVVHRHGASGTSLEHVVFVLYDEPAYQAFERVWRFSQGTSTG
jgi:O-acetyl-ADP-ribose deacetylase (regulator of RNase III)